MTNTDENREQQEIIALLPWHATGTLDPHDAARVEEALARDPELAHHYDLAREEMFETVRVNESLGAPSSRVAQRLFAAIDAAGAAPARRSQGAGLAPRLLGFFAGLTPRTLAFASGVAALAILLQAGVITTMLVGGHGTRFETASAPAADGPTVLIGFVPQATLAEIMEFLDAYGGTIVDGPRAGMFVVRLPAGAKRDEIMGKMRGSKIVRFVAPGATSGAPKAGR